MLNSIPQHDQDLFKQTVLQHITTKLPTEEWELFRDHWCMVNQRMDPDAGPNPDLTPNQLVNVALTSMRNEVAHLLKSFGKQIEVVGVAAAPARLFCTARWVLLLVSPAPRRIDARHQPLLPQLPVRLVTMGYIDGYRLPTA